MANNVLASPLSDGGLAGIFQYPQGPFVPSAEYDKRLLPDVEDIDLAANKGPEVSVAPKGLGPTGTVTSNLPIATGTPQVNQANRLIAYKDDFYDRIQVNPSELALGNLLSTQVRDVEVWNAYVKDPRNLLAITAVGDTTGVNLQEPVGGGAPTTFAPLESRIYEVSVTTTGPPLVAVEYTFDFDTEDPTLDITARRILLFAFEPNWQTAPIERLEWITNILESDNGTEQRIQLRDRPRRSYEINVAVNGRDRRLLEGYMHAWKSRVFGLPVFTDCNLLENDLPAGSMSVPVTESTDYQSFIVDNLLLFLDGPFNNESVEIASITSNEIFFKTATLQDWPATTKFYPVFTARLLENEAGTQDTDEFLEGTYNFTLDNNVKTTEQDRDVPYQGLYVLEEKPDRSTSPTLGWEGKVVILDYVPNLFTVDVRANNPDLVRTENEFKLQGRDAIWSWRQWAAARRGRAVPFYFSSDQSDFILEQTIGAGDSVAVIEDNRYRELYQQRPGVRDFKMELNDGTVFYRRITGSGEGSSEGLENLFFDTPLGQQVEPEDVKKWSFLHPVRLDSDTVEFRWETHEIVTINMTMRVLPI